MDGSDQQSESSQKDMGSRIEKNISRFFSTLFESGPTKTNFVNPEPLTGFMSIAFGTDQEKTVDSLWEKGWVDISDMTNPDIRIFSGLQFAGRATDFISLHFFDRYFYKAAVFFEQTTFANTTVSFYNEIKSDLNDRYYKTSEDYAEYKSASLALFGAEDTAIASGKADYKSFWRFTSDNDIDDFVWLRITPDLRVVLSYEQGKISEKASERMRIQQESQKNSDY